jgi:hypothetical protein
MRTGPATNRSSHGRTRQPARAASTRVSGVSIRRPPLPNSARRTAPPGRPGPGPSRLARPTPGLVWRRTYRTGNRPRILPRPPSRSRKKPLPARFSDARQPLDLQPRPRSDGGFRRAPKQAPTSLPKRAGPGDNPVVARAVVVPGPDYRLGMPQPPDEGGTAVRVKSWTVTWPGITVTGTSVGGWSHIAVPSGLYCWATLTE